MRSRRESGYGSQYSAANPLTTQRDMGRALTPYHSHGGNRSAAKEFDAYGIREGSLRPEQGYGYGRSQQEGSDRQQHFR